MENSSVSLCQLTRGSDTHQLPGAHTHTQMMFSLPGVNCSFCNLLNRVAAEDMPVLLICGPSPQDEKKLQGSGSNSKERHTGDTGFCNASWGKD